MATELKELIELAQLKNDNAMLKIIARFTPLIKKYCIKMKNDEDFKSDIVLQLIEIINNIKFDRFRAGINDAVLVTYITTSMYHSYLKLLNDNYNKNNEICDDTMLNVQLNQSYVDDFVDNKVIFYNYLKAVLTDQECNIIRSIFIDKCPVSEIAIFMGISRQAVNQSKNRALHKLKKYI